jgi:hypothetical protein
VDGKSSVWIICIDAKVETDVNEDSATIIVRILRFEPNIILP